MTYLVCGLGSTLAPARCGGTLANSVKGRSQCVMAASTDSLALSREAASGAVSASLAALASLARQRRSSPASGGATCGAVAQRTEQGRPKALAVGSIPTSPSAVVSRVIVDLCLTT